MLNRLKQKFIARMCSGAMASFRKTPVRLCPEDIRNLKMSFSQHGEDLLLLDHLPLRQDTPRGIYIDAGCYDPFRYSNTRLLNLHGWHGINIDAASDVIELFQKVRPGDYNVCSALSDKVEERTFIGKKGMASRRLLRHEDQNSPEDETAEKVRTTTLAAVLESSPFRSEAVDVLDIDCELHDLAVLRGFPFHKTRPVLVCIEAHSAEESGACQEVLSGIGYLKIATRGPTLIFRDKESIPSSLPWYARMAEL